MKYQPKKYYIKTYGCQANLADSGTMAGILESLGFEKVVTKKNYRNEKEELMDLLPQTDLFIVNTCAVRQKSEDKVYGLGKVLKNISDDKHSKSPYVLISGCMVGSAKGERQRLAFSELRSKTKWADSYLSPSEIFDLPNVLRKNNLLSEWAIKKFDRENVQRVQEDEKQAYVNISSGCDNFCTFCVVPYARGKEISRSEKQILFEVKHLTDRGYKHITLCGQNVNSWGLTMSEKFEIRTGSEQKLPFADLLRKVHQIEGIEKIDFISSNPFDFTQDLIETIKLPKISDYMHIAVQSGNNDVLEKMNRRHTAEDFISLIQNIKNAKPTAEFGTDIIVGFPGETREQFMDTVELFKKIKFNVTYISIYSPRKGTPAEVHFKDNVSRDEKKWRHKYLTKIWQDSKVKIKT